MSVCAKAKDTLEFTSWSKSSAPSLSAWAIQGDKLAALRPKAVKTQLRRVIGVRGMFMVGVLIAAGIE
jgi:hypothetical protein